MNYFVTGIGTDVGKTVVSAVLVEALQADYWKPVQCGFPRDTEVVQSLVLNPNSRFHQETYLFEEPASPHQAAFKQGVSPKLDDFVAPSTNNHLVIEGAGGIMVPINQQEFMVDLVKKFADKTVLVANLYLGSINHTLLSIDALQKRGIDIEGIIFNGASNIHSESIIKSFSGSKCLLHLEPESDINAENVRKWAIKLRDTLGLT
jgi:dethiobiotin synthetase